ncbi:MAG: hypothetical protein IPJ03_16440 [Ignavibacteriales bacterium]|nr:hypothetical protein [Ignavibacteriales bacterium]
MKSWWQSKTLWLQIIGVVSILVGTKVPALDSFLKEYFSEVGIGWAVLNAILRAITKKEITLA